MIIRAWFWCLTSIGNLGNYHQRGVFCNLGDIQRKLWGNLGAMCSVSSHDEMVLDFKLSRWFQYISSCLSGNVECSFPRRLSIWLNVLGFFEPVWKSFVNHNLTNPNFFWCRYCKERGNLYGFENHGIINWKITTLNIFAFLFNLLVTLYNSALTKLVPLKTKLS